MDLIWTDPSGVPQGELSGVTMDMQYGDEGNDFELTHATTGAALTDGCLVGVEDTEIGGRVDGLRVDVSDGHTQTTITGRTWHGILAAKIVQPDAGADRLTVSGDANTIIRTIIGRVGLAGTFTTPTTASGITIKSHAFRRYISVWDGLRMMLSAVGARLDLRYRDGRCSIRAVTAATYGGADGDRRVDFTATRAWTQVNHIIGLGKGELRNRAVSHWYADANGAISQKQTLTGAREITQTYELTTVEGQELSDQTRDKLKELWTQGQVELTIPDDIGLHIDDHVRAYDPVSGVDVDSPIVRITVKIANGTPAIAYEAGAYDWPDDQA
ncbi:hypothetical protein [Bifidobacterium samirii]|uniref:Phage head fiber protein n=1 Tax=Bifidobacterium samirii TaxID=2306974 RepID=A0A430FUG6_9BIFI|nr:hypothetical protein [Bifidobacterium samirii]RSX56778.1 phage head fiber protein [Bifidobacterium samirii]